MEKYIVEGVKLSAIADAIRGKTGGVEAMTLDQMPLEIAGIQTGGGGGLAYDMGEFVLDSDIVFDITNGIPHALGEKPDFVLIWTDDFSDLSEENVSPYDTATSIGYMWLNGLTGMAQYLTSVVSNDMGIFIGFHLGASSRRVQASSPTSLAYALKQDAEPTANKIFIVQLANAYQKWRAGIRYKYFVSKAWWNVGGVFNAE